MNEDDTTSSSRIFVKIMMQEVTESMGLPTLKERFADPEIKALRGQLLHKCRTWCSHRRNARASQIPRIPTRPLTPPIPIPTLNPKRRMALATMTPPPFSVSSAASPSAGFSPSSARRQPLTISAAPSDEDEPRHGRDDRTDRRDDARGSYGQDRRESPARYRRRSVSDSGSPPRRRYDRSRERSPPPPPRESGRDRDRDRDYDRRRDDSRDRYRDRRR
ncbi:hypothetical protein EDB89DRAFT_2241807 [Lactarius sanguifluus]|nr:hypothetical protein EDB89DRAFT_2241807 [Lactarius sanguifluus]